MKNTKVPTAEILKMTDEQFAELKNAMRQSAPMTEAEADAFYAVVYNDAFQLFYGFLRLAHSYDEIDALNLMRKATQGDAGTIAFLDRADVPVETYVPTPVGLRQKFLVTGKANGFVAIPKEMNNFVTAWTRDVEDAYRFSAARALRTLFALRLSGAYDPASLTVTAAPRPFSYYRSA